MLQSGSRASCNQSLAFSIIYELTTVEQTSHPVNGKLPIFRDPLTNQNPTGLALMDKLNNNKLLRGNLLLILENANRVFYNLRVISYDLQVHNSSSFQPP